MCQSITINTQSSAVYYPGGSAGSVFSGRNAVNKKKDAYEFIDLHRHAMIKILAVFG